VGARGYQQRRAPELYSFTKIQDQHEAFIGSKKGVLAQKADDS
jgi:hypothetical protein